MRFLFGRAALAGTGAELRAAGVSSLGEEDKVVDCGRGVVEGQDSRQTTAEDCLGQGRLALANLNAERERDSSITRGEEYSSLLSAREESSIGVTIGEVRFCFTCGGSEAFMSA